MEERAMRTVTFGLIGLAAVVVAGSASAEDTYRNPDNCVADVERLDANGDGFVDNTEYAAYGDIDTNVDVDGDGRISPDEKVVACKSGAMRGLVPEN